MPTDEFVQAFVRDAFSGLINKKRAGSRPKDPNPFRRQVQEETEARKVIQFDRAKEKLARGKSLRGGL